MPLTQTSLQGSKIKTVKSRSAQLTHPTQTPINWLFKLSETLAQKLRLLHKCVSCTLAVSRSLCSSVAFCVRCCTSFCRLPCKGRIFACSSCLFHSYALYYSCCSDD